MVSRCIFSTLYYSLREFSFFFLLFLLRWILVQCFLSLCLKLDLGNITLQDILITQVLWSGWDTGYIKISWKLWHMGTRNQRVQNHPLYCLNSMGRKFRDHKISRRSFGRFCRSPNSLLMGFTFLMDANTSKYFYNFLMGVKQTLISHWKMKKNLWNWEISFTFSWYLKISMFTFTS